MVITAATIDQTVTIDEDYATASSSYTTEDMVKKDTGFMVLPTYKLLFWASGSELLRGSLNSLHSCCDRGFQHQQSVATRA
jgi:hypothetical protein